METNDPIPFLFFSYFLGETEKLVELLLEGYDHILDAEDDKANIVDVATERDHEATVQFLQSIPNYVVKENTQFFFFFKTFVLR